MAAMGSQVGASVLVLSRETLRRCVIAGAEKVIAHREQLNAINVFPVPDRDTGTNLAATMRAVVAGLRKPLPSVDAVGKTLAASALAGAQGNSGVILAQFFQGLREGIGDSVQVTVDRFAAATDDDDGVIGAGQEGSGDGVVDERASGDGVEDLGGSALHALSEAGGEDDGNQLAHNTTR